MSKVTKCRAGFSFTSKQLREDKIYVEKYRKEFLTKYPGVEFEIKVSMPYTYTFLPKDYEKVQKLIRQLLLDKYFRYVCSSGTTINGGNWYKEEG